MSGRRAAVSWFDEIDVAHVRTLIFRLSRAERTPDAITRDEHDSVLREARAVLEALLKSIEGRS